MYSPITKIPICGVKVTHFNFIFEMKENLNSPSNGIDSTLEISFLKLAKSNEDAVSDLSNLISAVTQIESAKKVVVPYSKLIDAIIDLLDKVDFSVLFYPETEQQAARFVELASKKIEGTIDAIESTELQQLESSFVVYEANKNPNVYIFEIVRQLIYQLNKFGLDIACFQGATWVYNGNYWIAISEEQRIELIRRAAIKITGNTHHAGFHSNTDSIIKQLINWTTVTPPLDSNDIVVINLQNGTFEIAGSKQRLREFNKGDYLTYQLPFSYDPSATAPLFQAYLDRVLPEKSSQMVLQEYAGSLFVKNRSSLAKIEKVLMLFGTGANGKSVFYEVLTALLGNENVTHYSLEDLTDSKGYHRYMIGGKLLNYSSELGKDFQIDTFKKIASGEPLGVRLPHQRPTVLHQYAKLIINCNELPTKREYTDAFFRRLLIVPFTVTIPESEQDRALHTKIITSELAGVFNWVLQGLNRLIRQGNFTDCDAVKRALHTYKIETNSAYMFIEDAGYEVDLTVKTPYKDIYSEYVIYCKENNYKVFSAKSFASQLKAITGETTFKGEKNRTFIHLTNKK